MIRPGRADITQIRSDSRIASSISWVTNSTVVPSDCQTSSSNCCIDSRVCASSAPNGSSISSAFGDIASTRAMPTRWRMPPDNCTGSASAKDSRPTTCSRFARFRFVFGARDASEPAARTSRCPRRSARETAPLPETPRRGPGPAGSPSGRRTTRCLRCVFSKPASRLSSVDFPQPEGPSSATNSPSPIARLMSSSARTSDWPEKVFETLSNADRAHRYTSRLE